MKFKCISKNKLIILILVAIFSMVLLFLCHFYEWDLMVSDSGGALEMSERAQVLEQMKVRPHDPWPGNHGHVLLAYPGSSESSKAYIESGGNFSPAVGSFGVSVWVTDQEGKLIKASDNIPIDELRQNFDFPVHHTLPQYVTDTAYYHLNWSSNDVGSWTMNLQGKSPAYKLNIVLRSVGPAGGPIHQLSMEKDTLFVNRRWSVSLDTPVKNFTLGEEAPGWMTLNSQERQVYSQNGWAFARITFAPEQAVKLTITDLQIPEQKNPLLFADTSIDMPMQIKTPNAQFNESVRAQISHMEMGLVGLETRPGEPTNYPLPWLRDGAYVLVALARAGKHEIAKKLAKDFVEKDFFGGFGAEADAPGLSLWALITVAKSIDDPDFNQWLWPHIQRKADFIISMKNTQDAIYESYDGPLVPAHKHRSDNNLVAMPVQDGLIQGRMDLHFPVMFINAVSYLGLREAADMAAGMGSFNQQQKWEQAAADLQKAWQAALETSVADNDRTFISGMWPSGIAVKSQSIYTSLLERRWNKGRTADGEFIRRPLWTYFDLAEAHQWLLLNQSDRAWKTLAWFFSHQSAPGMFTWWEGNGEENSFGRWSHVRGWVRPKGVTPHYWTAAEMLLLQMDMLAYAHPTDRSAVVIGAGVPAEWIQSPISVKRLRVDDTLVSWEWDTQVMKVTLTGSRKNVVLGQVFPRSAKIILSN